MRLPLHIVLSIKGASKVGMLFRIITLNDDEAVTAPSNAVTVIGNVPATFDYIGASVKI